MGQEIGQKIRHKEGEEDWRKKIGRKIGKDRTKLGRDNGTRNRIKDRTKSRRRKSDNISLLELRFSTTVEVHFKSPKRTNGGYKVEKTFWFCDLFSDSEFTAVRVMESS